MLLCNTYLKIYVNAHYTLHTYKCLIDLKLGTHDCIIISHDSRHDCNIFSFSKALAWSLVKTFLNTKYGNPNTLSDWIGETQCLYNVKCPRLTLNASGYPPPVCVCVCMRPLLKGMDCDKRTRSHVLNMMVWLSFSRTLSVACRQKTTLPRLFVQSENYN